MAEEMSSIAIVDHPSEALAAYGSREDVKELATRLQKFMPGGDKLTPDEAMAGAQYALSIGANPLNGEVYIFKDWRGKLIMVEGYKLLERWARRQCNYMERYADVPKDQLEDGDIAARCWILRDDMRPALREMVDLGATWSEAFEATATFADGVISQKERTTKDGKQIEPPKGWTWHQKARVRALKNAIHQAYGMPSLREIAAASWEAGGVQTEPEDWEGTEQYDRRGAEALAHARAIRREAEPMTEEDRAAGAAALFGQVVEAETREVAPEERMTFEQAADFTAKDGRRYGDMTVDELTVIEENLSNWINGHRGSKSVNEAVERRDAIGIVIAAKINDDDAAGRAAVDELQAEADAEAETLTPPMF